MKILEGLDKEKFTEEFLKAYLQDGFTAMTKREIDLLILRLLVDHKDGWSWENPPNAFEMAQALKAKRTRLRSMMDELSFRMLADEKRAKARLKSLIEKQCEDEGNAVTGAGSVRLQIEDGFLREFAKSLVQEDFGIVDTSFDRSIITLSGAKFLSLVAHLFDAEQKAELEKQLEASKEKLAGDDKKSIWRKFLDGVATGAGEKIGETAVRYGLAALSGGVTEVAELVDAITGKLSSPGQGDASGGVAV